MSFTFKKSEKGNPGNYRFAVLYLLIAAKQRVNLKFNPTIFAF